MSSSLIDSNHCGSLYVLEREGLNQLGSVFIHKMTLILHTAALSHTTQNNPNPFFFYLNVLFLPSIYLVKNLGIQPVET